MKIAVNTRLLIPNKINDGIAWFTYETLHRITRQHPGVQFYFIFDRPYSKEFLFHNNITPVVAGLPTRHPLLWYMWFEKTLPKVLKKINPDLFLSPDGYLSLSSGTPSLPVIHDINFYHRPQDLPFFNRHYYRYFFPRYAQKARRIATVSNYSKQDISQSYHINQDRIDVVYNGANTLFKALDEKDRFKVKQEYTNGNDYFLFVGNLHPRKNIHGLLKAFDAFKTCSNNAIKLLIVGEAMFKTKEISQTYKKMKYRDDVIFTGKLPPNELRKVYGAAIALTFVPFFEGFGIPALEAMYCHVPVICSNTTSLPEVTGEAAILTDPESIEEIAASMLKITDDNNLRNKLIEKSKERKAKFNWDQTAEKLWDSITKCLE